MYILFDNLFVIFSTSLMKHILLRIFENSIPGKNIEKTEIVCFQFARKNKNTQ